MKQLKGVCIGAGYFSQFQYEAWTRIPQVEIAALCDIDEARASQVMTKYGVKKHYQNYLEMLDAEQPDFVDIITPPALHVEMTREALQRGIHVICQKPLAPTIEASKELRDLVHSQSARFMVHENWRFQPWYREIKRLLKMHQVPQFL